MGSTARPAGHTAEKAGHTAEAVAAVVVDYDTGDVLADCVASLVAAGVHRVVVVENGSAGGARRALDRRGLEVPVVSPGRNVGYGAGANRGMAALAGDGAGVAGVGPGESGGRPRYVMVCNPDLEVRPGAVETLVAALEDEPSWAVVGPRILTANGDVYPSVRRFPSMRDAAGHALLALLRPDNRFSRRYRPSDAGGDRRAPADWVSGACMMARAAAMEELGGFDESYFMFAEDMDLCWRAHRAGWGVGVEPAAIVVHAGGVARRRHPYRMLVAHHRSAWRFAVRTTRGWRRVALPLAAAVLGLRLVAAVADEALRTRREAPPPGRA
jgi:N-acetylglucosaminyl-diphospho-decaprenol L-rhamnosyltransferase